jgi:multiple sugar transport system substrate-binding protein
LLKKTLLPIIILIIMSMLAACGGGDTNNNAGQNNTSSDATSVEKTDVNVWLWDMSESREKLYDEFEKEYPQYNVVMTAVENKDMAQKLQTTLASGGDLPDVAWLEATNRGKLFSLGIWEDLSQPPYNLDTSDVLDYLIPLETTEDGTYVGPESPSVAGMAYKRAMAKEYFGTDDPEEMEGIFTDWDTFIEKGKEVNQKSNGNAYMFASLGDAFTFFKGQTSTPFIQDKVLNLKKSVAPMLERLVEMKKAGIVDVLETGSPALGASYANDVHIFYPAANWSVEFTIKANDPDGVGRWGFMVPPGGPFPWGGTVQGVPKEAKNKEGGAALIKFLFLSEKGSELSRDYKGNFTPYKPVYSITDFYSAEDEHFAGQNVQKAIAEDIFPNISEDDVRIPNEYDQDINNQINLAIKTINASKGGNVDIQEIVKKMEDNLLSQHPELKRK